MKYKGKCDEIHGGRFSQEVWRPAPERRKMKPNQEPEQLRRGKLVNSAASYSESKG
jgi:hypothetical protein